MRLSTQHSIPIFLLAGVLTCAIRLAWLASASNTPTATPPAFPPNHETAKSWESDAEESQSSDPDNRQVTNDIELSSDNTFDSARLPVQTLSTPERRLEAIDALGQSGNTKAVMTLRVLLDDPDALVREEAVEALARIGDASSIAGLGYALSDDVGMVRMLAVDTLADIGSDEALANLAVVTADKDRTVRIAAIEALGESTSVSATLLLQTFLTDEDEMVRYLASVYLGDYLTNQDEMLP